MAEVVLKVYVECLGNNAVLGECLESVWRVTKALGVI